MRAVAIAAVVLLAAAGQRRLGWSLGLAILVIELGTLAYVALDDLRRNQILNAITYPGSVGGLLVAPLTPGLSRGSALAGAVLAALPFLTVALLRPAAAGMGDAKLAFMVGAMAGLWPGWRVIYAVGLALASALAAAGVLVIFRRADLKTPLPFGAFLAGSAMLILALAYP